jgi:hypothetical protein
VIDSDNRCTTLGYEIDYDIKKSFIALTPVLYKVPKCLFIAAIQSLLMEGEKQSLKIEKKKTFY